MNQSRLLIIARKFNDVFYAVSVPDWEKFNQHILIIVADNNLGKNFPLGKCFDKVLYLPQKKSKIINLLNAVVKINRLKSDLQCNAIALSNPTMAINQYLIKKANCNYVLFLEDGLMNYYDYSPRQTWQKRLICRILRINENDILSKISKTYISNTQLAKYYFGQPCQLHINFNHILSNIDGVENFSDKRIFVGQDLYHYGYCSINEYNARVNSLLKKLKVDIYIPHAFASPEEEITGCDIRVITGATMEVLAAQQDFTIISFNSSVLFTTKNINPKIKTIAIIPKGFNLLLPDIIRNSCDTIIQE